ncbi:hypothetical protein [Sporosarcina sp. FA9]|uniref:hypothetical protein n=1 Tax=Sporosarcina sp. FA9 TaxID=3413030 RepID=UPI003F6564B4
MSKSVKIKKKNRILHVETSRLASFLNQGYDQIDDDGKVIKLATGGRTVSLPEHNKVLEELDVLKKSFADSEEFNKLQDAFQELSNEKDKLTLDFEEQTKEITVLKGKLTKAENALEASKEPKK